MKEGLGCHEHDAKQGVHHLSLLIIWIHLFVLVVLYNRRLPEDGTDYEGS